MKLVKLIIALIILFLSQSFGRAQDATASGPLTEDKTVKVDDQLEVNKDALLNGSTEDIRITAVNIMLASENPLARQVLLDTLAKADNPGARAAICKGINQSRLGGRGIPKKEEFLQPLLGMLKERDPATVKLASEALLCFDYTTGGKAIEGIARDQAEKTEVRLNAMQALKLQPNKGATITLIQLVDDPQEIISSTAREVLVSLGMPVGVDAQARSQAIADLEAMSDEAFLRGWIFRQDERIRQERLVADQWRRLYLDALNKLYAQVQAPQRGDFLLPHLQSSQTDRKLWALDKVYQWRLEPSTVLPDSLTPALIGLLSDPDKSVRLAAATQLFNIIKMDSADTLLKLLEREQDQQVRTKLFAALGEACRLALLTGGIDGAVKTRILQWAARFLEEIDVAQVRQGADVIGKLLEKNGLAEDEVARYLGLLKGRYEQEQPGDAVLRGDLLRTMAVLCSDRSDCRVLARKQFRPLFEKAMADEADRVREEAIDGLAGIDKTAALGLLRRSEYINDKSPKVRSRIIALAKDVGGPEDIDWLAGKIGSGAESDAAWQTLLTIFSRSDATVLTKWLDRFVGDRQQGRLTDSQWLGLLEIAEGKAESRPELQVRVLRLCVEYYTQKAQPDSLRAYLMKLSGVVTKEERPGILAKVLQMDLQAGNVEKASSVLQSVLAAGDLAEDDEVSRAVTAYLALAQGSESPDPLKVLQEVFSKVKLAEPRPIWDELRGRWLTPPSGSDTAGLPQEGNAVGG